MKVQGRHYRTIWVADGEESVEVIDQTQLPHRFVIARLKTHQEVAQAIARMVVRGAPLIGAAAAYGVWLGMRADSSDQQLASVHESLLATRPTAINLRWALDRMRARLLSAPRSERAAHALAEATTIADEDATQCQTIGAHGLKILQAILKQGRRLNVLTHCNAGWLATVDWGTALAPIYAAFDQGIDIHVFVDETRPRNQGASLTAWELGQHGVPHMVIVDNAGGLLMQRGLVDVCLVGTDRTSANGDVCNKIGTYLKALAAFDNGVPFYAAVPSSSIDWGITDGVRDIPIEERDASEVATISGVDAQGVARTVRLLPEGSPALNFGFDVTPARLMTGLITERGVCPATVEGLRRLHPDSV